MPWSAADASKHHKGLSDDSKERWARIANAILSKTGDEASAIKIANSRVKPSKDVIKRRLTNGRSASR